VGRFDPDKLAGEGIACLRNLLALAGKEAGGQIQPYTQSEVWSMQRSRIENVLRQAERLGVKTTILGASQRGLQQ
jgi:hypothetical protein